MDDLAGPVALDPEEGVATGDITHTLSLKDGDCFVVADPQGDIAGGVDGFFHNDTRILSRLRLMVGDKLPSRLSYGVSRDNAVFSFHGANLALPPVGGRATPRGVIHIERKRTLKGQRLYERVRLENFGLDEVMLPLSYEFGADFRDMFEVRGLRRPKRGVLAEPKVEGRCAEFAYDGLDGVRRTCALGFSEPPWRLTHRRADFMFTLAPGRRLELFVEAGVERADPPSRERFVAALAQAKREVRDRRDQGGALSAPDRAFRNWLDQSRSDIALLTTSLPTGPYPYAGIPWFSTTFGRDGIIVAWQLLWLDPSLAKGVLRRLAATQATRVDSFQDSAPGKIMHEARRGEMAVLREVAFGSYYGGVDTTPLFVALAGAYLERTDDLELIQELWPNLRAAIEWLDTHGDCNGDGLIDYRRGETTGLSNQGWKDSEDSVFHADGRFPKGPVALVEVQGYAFAAWRAMATMAERLGVEGGDAWIARAETMREAVERLYWMEDKGFYGIAIDGDGALCEPETSNPGHLLFTGLPSAERARRVTERLLAADFDSGWGLRTLAMSAVRFNPMSYHNGSIWPHDTAIGIAGMARYGARDGPAKVMCDLFQASLYFDMRMPELFCGFPREGDDPPIAYPVACMPQAWSAGAVFMMLQACLGLTIDAAQRRIRLVRPTLPPGVDQLSLDGLEVGGGRVNLRFQRLDDGVAVTPTAGSDPTVAIVLEG